MVRSLLLSSLVVVGLCRPSRVAAQDLAWRTDFVFYGDNTEYFTPFREGATLLGAQFHSYVVFDATDRVQLLAGVFGDHESGAADFLDPVKPILSLRYRTRTSLGVLGTLLTERRHGLLEPLAVRQLAITRPVEYGLQWIERRRVWEAEIFINWQALNTPTSREIFDYGLVARLKPWGPLSLEYQAHGLHHGGQLFDAGVPVTNNFAGGFGARLAGAVGPLGRSELALFRLQSRGNIDPAPPAGRPDRGRGTYLEASVEPHGWFVLSGRQWWGRDFLSDEGDTRYNSPGTDSTFYRSRRRLTEIGARREFRLDGGVTFEAELRFSRLDDEPSQAISGTNWEYDYRIRALVPLRIQLR